MSFRPGYVNSVGGVQSPALRFFLSQVAPSRPTVVTADARYLAFTKRPAPSPLSSLAFELANLLRVAPLIDYKPTNYFGGEGGQHDFWQLPPGVEKA